MIKIQKDSVNTVVVTLTENQTVTAPIYLFKFTNQNSNVDYYFIANDTSGHKKRFNSFEVTETNSPDTLNGEVQLPETGFYDYVIYQTSLTTTSGLTDASEAVEDIVKPLEYGKVFVEFTDTSTVNYTPQSNTAIIYNPE